MSMQIDTTTIQYPTKYSNQRKLVRTSSGTLVLFCVIEGLVGNDVKYKTSTDNGTNWSSWIDAYATTDVAYRAADFDIYLDSNDDILLTWGQPSGNYIKFRKLTNNGDDTWANGTIVEIDNSVSIQPTITRRSNDDICVAARSGSTNKLWFYLSDDEGLNWATVDKSAPPYNTPEMVDILPVGSDVWIFIRNGARLDVQKFSGSWASTNISTTLPASNGTLCTLKVSDTEIYVATNTANGILLYLYNGFSWDAGTLMSDNALDSQPSLGLIDTYLFLVWRDYDGSNYNINYRKKITAAWSSEVQVTNDATDDNNPSVIEQGTRYAPIVWSRGDSSPYSIMFESATVIATKQLTPTLEWNVSNLEQLSPNPQLQWATSLGKKFCPNLINFDFSQGVPAITSFKVPMTVYGCLYGYSIYLKNTGSAGQTELKIYINSTLKKTIQIDADDSEYSDVYYFGLTDELDVLDYLEVQVTNVATDAEILKFNIYQMSFPFKLDKLMLANIKDDFVVTTLAEKYLSSSADYWIIELNQPVDCINSANGFTTEGLVVSLTATVEDGLFKNSRIKIIPITDTTLNKITIDVKDGVGESYSLDVTFFQIDNFAFLLDYYSDSTITTEIYIAASHYKYSFDGGVTYSAWSLVSDSSITLDLSGESEGTKSLVIKYRLGNKEFTDSKTIQYFSSAIDCSINFAKAGFQLTYSDDVPLYAVEIYGDDNLLDTTNPTTFTGFNSVTRDDANNTIQINAGTLYQDSRKYDYTSAIHTITIDITATIKILIFAFNQNTKVFEWIEQSDVDASGESAVIPEYYTPLYYTTYTISPTSPTEYGIVFTREEYAPIELVLFDSVNYSEIVVRVKDTAGRHTDFTRNYYKTHYTDVWRTITVKDGSDNVVKQGQIHFNTNLIFTINLDKVY